MGSKTQLERRKRKRKTERRKGRLEKKQTRKQENEKLIGSKAREAHHKDFGKEV